MTQATAERELTIAQHSRFDRIDPAARVVGWDDRLAGPVVELPDGRRSTVSRFGRLHPVRTAA